MSLDILNSYWQNFIWKISKAIKNVNKITKTEDMWKEVTHKFSQARVGSWYYNYKGLNSIALMAVADVGYKINVYMFM